MACLFCLAIPCRLYGLTERDVRWSGKAIEEFEKQICDKTIEIVVSETAESLVCVDQVFDKDGKDIVQHLIDSRFLPEANSGRPARLAAVAPAPLEVLAPVALQEQKHAAVAPKALTAELAVSKVSSPQSVTSSTYSLEAFPGDKSVITVSHTNTPVNFYIQRSDKEHEMMLLCLELHDECIFSDITSYTPKSIGEMVGARFDGAYARAEVRSLGVSRCDVFFIDYGNRESILMTDLHPLPTKYLNLPAQALNCKLHGIQGTQACGEFSHTACDFFKRLVLDQTGITVRYKGGSGDVNIKAVDLVVENKESVTETLVDRGHATPIMARSITPKAQQQSGARSPYSQSITVPPNSHSSPTLEAQQADIQTVMLLDECLVVGCAVTESLDIYTQLVNKDVVKMSSEVMKLVNSYCERTPYDGTFTPATNSLCAAQFAEDNMWYRARVVRVAARTISVFFVDFGNTETVSAQNVRPFQSEWQRFPFLATRCRLDGVSTVNVPDETVVQELKALTMEKQLTCRVVRRDGDVHVCHMQSADGQTDINQCIQQLMHRAPKMSLEEENRILREKLERLMRDN